MMKFMYGKKGTRWKCVREKLDESWKIALVALKNMCREKHIVDVACYSPKYYIFQQILSHESVHSLFLPLYQLSMVDGAHWAKGKWEIFPKTLKHRQSRAKRRTRLRGEPSIPEIPIDTSKVVSWNVEGLIIWKLKVKWNHQSHPSLPVVDSFCCGTTWRSSWMFWNHFGSMLRANLKRNMMNGAFVRRIGARGWWHLNVSCSTCVHYRERDALYSGLKRTRHFSARNFSCSTMSLKCN